MELDNWQKEILATQGNICLRSGRQVGKSTVVSMKAAKFAVANPNKTILVISAVERQAYHLFEMILGVLYDNYRTYIKKGRDKPTKHKITLNNGSVIYSLPTGLSGYGIRGYTVDLLIADEAAFIPEDVWTAVTPMLAMTGGNLWLLSTPHGKGGYFYESFFDDNFKNFHISTEEVLNFPNRSQRQKDDLKKKLETEKKRMSTIEYAQEYLGEFADELKQVFSDELIKKVCVLKRRPQLIKRERRYYLGADIAGLGGDEITFEILDKIAHDHIEQVENIVKIKQLTTQTAEDILTLNESYNFKSIGIDDAGVGFGVWSDLITNDKTKRKTYALNNATRNIDKDRGKKLMKEEMYMNLLALMESERIKLLDDDEIVQSLKSIQYEYLKKESEKTQLRIFGVYSHITEGLIRAAWLCSQDKDLNIFIHSF